MERWQGKVAVVTGASAGIGSAVCVALASAGMHVVGLARRSALVDKLQSEVKGKGCIVSRPCDVSKSEEVTEAFKWIEDKFGCVHVMVNNAGVFYFGHITDVGKNPLSEAQLMATIDVNLKGPILCTKHAVASMTRHNFHGHVITMNSISGHNVPFQSYLNVYPSSKFAITGFVASLANELCHFKSKIKTTSISPGLVATDMVRILDDPDDPTVPMLSPVDVADAVVYALSTPPSVNIEELTITPVFELK